MSSSSPEKSVPNGATAVVVNPVGPKSSSTQQQLESIRGKAEQAMGETVDAFLSKPFQTTAVTLSFLAAILSVISTFTPWFRTMSGPTVLRKYELRARNVLRIIMYYVYVLSAI